MKDLVGQGKPLYSFLDKAAGLLKRKVGTGSEFLKELMAIPGVKQTEVSERGLGELLNAPKMTHEQFLAALQSKPAPAIKEMVLGEPVQDKKLRDKAWEQAHEDAIDEYLNSGHTYDQARLYAPEVADRNINRYLPEGSKEYATHHSEWTIPGGENYREMLIKMPRKQFPGDPTKEVFRGIPQHFGGEPGIVASLRLKDRTGPNGEKLLHLEELQSDWHQQGREHGYRVPGFAQQKEDLLNKVFAASKKHFELQDQFNKSAEWSKELEKRLNSNHPDFQPGGYRRKEVEEQKAFHDKNVVDLLPQVMRAEDEHRNLEQEFNKKYSRASKAVPDAPFKKNWEEMALKRLVHHAAEKGYHGIVVTPGDEQANRYSLAKHVDEISHNPRTNMMTGEKSKSVRIDMKSGAPVQLGVDTSGVIDNVSNKDHESLIGKHLSEVVGGDIAKNIMNEERGILSPKDLKIGGEGMKGFYDKKVPNIFNSIGKKYGVKTQLHGVDLQSRGKERTPEEFEQAVQGAGMTMANLPMERAKEFDYHPKKVPVHYFPITDQMRQDVVKNGLPLYKQGGDVHASLDKMKYELSNRKG